MASWKKVLVEDANIQVGTINATLGEATDLGDGQLSANLVVSSTDGASAGNLTVAEVTFGTAAFDAASSFATSAQGDLADSSVQPGNFLSDVITGTAAGKGGISVSGGDNKIFGSDSADITLDLDINSVVSTLAAVQTSDLIALQDVSDSNKTKKATVANIIAAVSSGVTTFNAGRNLTEADGDTEGTIDLNLDNILVQVNQITSTEATAGNSDEDGTSFFLRGGASTGQGLGGSLSFQVTQPAASTGTVLNSYTTALGINQTGHATFSYGVEIVNADGPTALDLSNQNIVDVGDIDADSISIADAAVGLTIDFTGGDTGKNKIKIDDNLAEALTIEQNGNDYLNIKTTNSSEEVKLGTGVSGTAITIGHSTSETTIGDNLTVSGNLTVNGDTTTVDTTNLLVEDQFIYLNNSGSDTNVDRDGGFVVEGNTKSVAFGYHQSDDRFVFDKTGATSGMTAIDPDAFFTHVHTNSAIPTDGSNGADSDLAQVGNLYVNSTNQDIYIYS